MMITRAALFATCVLTAASAAEPVTGNVGVVACDAWGAHRAVSGAAAAEEQWIIGFLAGIGHMRLGELEPLHAIDPGSVWIWIDDYCRAHPTAAIAQAAAAFTVAHPR